MGRKLRSIQIWIELCVLGMRRGLRVFPWDESLEASSESNPTLLLVEPLALLEVEPNQEFRSLICEGANVLPSKFMEDAFRDGYGCGERLI
ncbi:hypothetical protein ZIOFF_062605 [Zingiber officinale]|uniref:Uncharacterized protein n=1 Tax=Zingiber officinale TaxID=94328 RepID=A0A8J5KFH4_ZINOF|nr:hypothetical protein ZIOFF_062605 [Zingiber officinale]